MRVAMPNIPTESTLKNLSDTHEATIAYFIRRPRNDSHAIMNEDYYTDGYTSPRMREFPRTIAI